MDLDWQSLVLNLESFVWLYPFVMGWLWITGGVLYWLMRERESPPSSELPVMEDPPRVAVILKTAMATAKIT